MQKIFVKHMQCFAELMEKRYCLTMSGSLHLRDDFAAWWIDFLRKSHKQDWKTSKYTAKVILKLSWLKRIFVISSSTLSLVAIWSLNFIIINLITSINPLRNPSLRLLHNPYEIIVKKNVARSRTRYVPSYVCMVCMREIFIFFSD